MTNLEMVVTEFLATGKKELGEIVADLDVQEIMALRKKTDAIRKKWQANTEGLLVTPADAAVLVNKMAPAQTLSRAQFAQLEQGLRALKAEREAKASTPIYTAQMAVNDLMALFK